MRDPGLQPERTALAWRRTTIAASGVALVCSITALRVGVFPVAIVAAVVAGLIVVSSALRPVRSRMSAAEDHDSGRPYPWPALLLLTVCVCAVSVLGGALAVAGALDR